MNREEPSAPVFSSVGSGDTQAEEDLWQRHKAERGVWTKPMLAALARGVKGKKWLSLIDKISTDILPRMKICGNASLEKWLARPAPDRC